MHAPGLHPAFHPSRSLTQPAAEFGGRLLEGGRREGHGAIAGTSQPEPEVGIFGDVIGVPSADLAQRGGTEVRY